MPPNDNLREALQEFISQHAITQTTDPETGLRWFSLADICRVLGNNTTNTARRLPPGTVERRPLPTSSGYQYAWQVTLHGLTAALISSRHPDAVEPRRLVLDSALSALTPLSALTTKESL